MNEHAHYLQEHFDEIKQIIHREYDITDISYDTWIAPLSFLEIREDTVYIGVPQEIAPALSHITKIYRDFFRVIIAEQTGTSYEISFILPEESSYNNEEESHSVDGFDEQSRRSHLNPRYTFDSFVVGKNNNLAQAASLAVAESPGEAYNPLFLYSDAGLGKTHLMHSIGNYIISHRPKARVLYVTSETFTNEVIASIRSGSTQEMSKMRGKYRNVDVLMVDDVQFIIGKESTQEEFFHTFNELHSAGKQIVLSSDKPPKDMTTLEERFRSRFEWGLIADIQPPDYETRMAILQKNAENYPGHIDDEVFAYIANNVKSNIRELEGAFNKITAQSRILGEHIDLKKAEEGLKDIISKREQAVTPSFIIDKVCSYYGISKEDIISQKRSKDIALPRQTAMYFIRTMTDTSFDEIGKSLGGRDHTTVMSGINKIKEQIQLDRSFADQVEKIRQLIKPTV
ncbi:MAG: chromosomal replication initiator protein DnaA [Lachnospiraceae bacterium]|nr:chromosomal replication initiator protein DnaA [Lachnospiraceae bacterium]